MDWGSEDVEVVVVESPEAELVLFELSGRLGLEDTKDDNKRGFWWFA